MQLQELYEHNLTPHEVLQNFRHHDASSYGFSMLEVFGEPDEYSTTCLTWYNISRFTKTFLKDESIPHSFPSEHRDYVYSTWEFEIPEKLHNLFAHVTGSIIIDGLKNEITARCGGIKANAITLQFVKEVVEGRISTNPENAKEEYGNRIEAWKNPEWFENRMGD